MVPEQEGWVRTLDESELREDMVNLAAPKGVSVILIKRGDRLYALRNRCAHMACTLASGHLDGHTIRCACHGWTFDITNGQFIHAREITIPTYACRSEDGQVFVKLEAS
jgi:3-phenylpropionate/trans-cinnamate dioxygenase ferredoxin subunit